MEQGSIDWEDTGQLKWMDLKINKGTEWNNKKARTERIIQENRWYENKERLKTEIENEEK